MFSWNVMANGVPLFSIRSPGGGGPVIDAIVLPNSASWRSGGAGRSEDWFPIPSDDIWCSRDHGCVDGVGPTASGLVGPLRGS